MFYEESFLINLLKCQQCEETYEKNDEPSVLPCGKTICINCASDFKENQTLICYFCSKEHNYSESGFPKNELAANLIKEQEKVVREDKATFKLKSNLNELEILANDALNEMNNKEEYIKEHYDELRRLVQLSTELKIEKINLIKTKFIKKVNNYQLETLEKLKANKSFQQEINEIAKKATNFISQTKRLSFYDDLLINNQIEILQFEIEHIKLDKKMMKLEVNKNKLDETLVGSFQNPRFVYKLNRLFTSLSDGTLYEWNYYTGLVANTLIGHTKKITMLKFLSNNLALSGSEDSTMKLWNLSSSTCLKTYKGHKGQILYFDIATNDKLKKFNKSNLDKKLKSYLKGILIKNQRDLDKLLDKNYKIISSSSDNTIKVWSLNTGECLATLKGTQVCWLKVMNENIFGASKTSIKNWDENMITKNSHKASTINFSLFDIRFIKYLDDKNNDKLLLLCSNGLIIVWDIKLNVSLKRLDAHTEAVNNVQQISDEQILSCSDDKSIKLWNLMAGLNIKTFLGHLSSVLCLKLLTNDTFISGSSDYTVKLWNINSVDCLKTIKNELNIIKNFHMISNNEIINCYRSVGLNCIDINSGECVKKFLGHFVVTDKLIT